ncbi:hypothetical protein [Nocardioides jiangxiensis]|uniref:SPW repeat-containing protein n=1 Tax=Nocardioides jiangxiensis TaxID=3064524 RepID=A0ABT9B7H9_9ACTN|nr:hypothetical protein [Nocardioides sp. WY-20]MDO7869537.1 hypothetical protein [Nocardioides sp. WY-20]
MANPAFSKTLPRWWAWIVALAALSAGGALMTHSDESSTWFGLGFLVAAVGGVAWQILNRNDLAERLLLLAWLAVIGALVAVVPGAIGADQPVRFAAFGGLVAGLVLGEHWLRYRDARRRTTVGEPVGAAD